METVECKKVRVSLVRHIGAAAVPCVEEGDGVAAGDVIGLAPEKALGVNVHASITGTVTEVNDKFVEITA